MFLGLQDMDLPKDPELSPHTYYLHSVYTAYIQIIIKYTLPACVSSGFIRGSCGGIFLEFFSLEPKNIQNIERKACRDCCMIILMLHTSQVTC